jgi:hypothetical protein
MCALRIDGRDTCDQAATAGAIRSNLGWYRWRATPRHNRDDVGDFGQTQEYFMEHREDANNYIYVRREAGLVRLGFNAQGAGEVSNTWAGAWNAATENLMELRRFSGSARLYVAGALVITVVQPCVFATDFTQPVDWGSDAAGANQFDGTIGNP